MIEKCYFAIRNELLKKAVEDEVLRERLLSLLNSGSVYDLTVLIDLQDGKIIASSPAFQSGVSYDVVKVRALTSKERSEILDTLIEEEKGQSHLYPSRNAAIADILSMAASKTKNKNENKKD